MPHGRIKKAIKSFITGKTEVPMSIAGLTAIRTSPMEIPRKGVANITQAMRDKKGIVTDYSVKFNNGKIISILPIKGAFRGKIPQFFIDKRNKEIAVSRAKRKQQ